MDTLINMSRGMTKASDDQWRRIFNGKQTKNKPTRVCIRSKRQTRNGEACKLKQTKNKTTCACLPRSKRQTSSQMSNLDALKLKQTKKQSDTLIYVYLVLSVRRAMETLINASRRKKNYTRTYTLF